MLDTLTNALREQPDVDRFRPLPSNGVGVGKQLEKGISSTRSAVGFILMDSTLKPMVMNAEARQILSYPDKNANSDHSAFIAVTKIRSDLTAQFSGELPFVKEFWSGRRLYYCRAFAVDSSSKHPSGLSVAVLLERGPGLTSLSQVSLRFNLTRREEETLEHLLHGLTSKEIANRMRISPNTVKAFLRLIMTKMGVSSRSAIVLKTFTMRSQ